MQLTHDAFYVNSDIAHAETLPLCSFWDKQVLALELETIFRRTWLCFPKQFLREQKKHKSNISYLDILDLRGNAVCSQWFDESVFFKRDFEPKGSPALRCFLNRCPHAFYPMMLEETDESRSKFIQCQQHGLTTDCSGHLKAHPGFTELSEHVKNKFQLTEYVLHEWNDFYFMCRGLPEISFGQHFSPLNESVAKMNLNHFKYIKQTNERRIVAGNWKQHAWNYMDTLHINWIHKGPHGLQDAVDMTTYKTELYDMSSLQWAYAKNPADGFAPESLPDRFIDKDKPERRVFALWWFVFPNMTFNFYPWGLSINLYTPVRSDPEKTEFIWLHFVKDEEKYKQRNQHWLSAQVDAEDVSALGRVHENISVHTEPYRRGLFAPKLETGPHWFHHLVSRMLLDYKN